MPTSTPPHLKSLETAINGFSGLRYLAALTVGLTKTLHTRFAFVARRKADQPHFGTTVVMAENGEAAKPMVYDLRLAPCRSVFGGQSLTIPCNLIDLYPGQVGLDAYCGIPLGLKDGLPIGVLAVLSDKPFQDPDTDRVLKVFAERCARELDLVEDA
ncbi:MAG: hypothetical protein H7Y28_09190 [Rhodoferax sp.]|nr:hypothetical protein [Rhodoferax sp.]